MKTALSCLLALLLLLTMLPTAYADDNEMPFDDTNMWAKDSIQWAWENGIVNGVTETKFMPNKAVTHEEFMVMLYRFAGEPKVEFNYEPEAYPWLNENSYFYDACCWALYSNLDRVMGYGDFTLNIPMMRLHTVSYFYDYMRYEYEILRPDYPGINTYYPDLSWLPGISDKFTDMQYFMESPPLKWATYYGIIEGNPSKELKPQENLTRAEVVTMLKRYSENIVIEEHDYGV